MNGTSKLGCYASIVVLGLVFPGLAIAQLCDITSIEDLEAFTDESAPDEVFELRLIPAPGEGTYDQPPPTLEPEVPAGAPFDLAAMVVVNLCDLPPSLAEALMDVETVSPEYASLVVFRAVSEDPSLLLSACGVAGVEGLAESIELRLEAQSGHFLSACDPMSEAVASQSELESVPIHQLLAATLTHHHFVEQGEPYATELTRFLLGLPLAGEGSDPSVQLHPSTGGLPEEPLVSEAGELEAAFISALVDVPPSTRVFDSNLLDLQYNDFVTEDVPLGEGMGGIGLRRADRVTLSLAGMVEIEGPYRASDVEELLTTHRNGFANCIDDNASWIWSFSIDSSGSAAGIEFSEPVSLTGSEISCLRTRLEGLWFPYPSERGEVWVRVPISADSN